MNFVILFSIRNRTTEEFVHQIPELRCLAEDKESASVLDVCGAEMEKRAVETHQTLHIPRATLIRIRKGNRVNGLARQYVHCAGFRLSNDYPNNIGLFRTGHGADEVEVVYLENFDRLGPQGRLVPFGRRFHKVRCTPTISYTRYQLQKKN